jgi:hypothetical protein
MKSTIQYATSKKRIYPSYVFKALSETGLQHYSHDNEYFMVKYNDQWESYDKISRDKPFLNLPILDLSTLEVDI